MKHAVLVIALCALTGCGSPAARDYFNSGARLRAVGDATHATEPELETIACKRTLAAYDCAPVGVPEPVAMRLAPLPASLPDRVVPAVPVTPVDQVPVGRAPAEIAPAEPAPAP